MKLWEAAFMGVFDGLILFAFVAFILVASFIMGGF